MAHPVLDVSDGDGKATENLQLLRELTGASSITSKDVDDVYKEIKVTGDVSVERVPDDDDGAANYDSYTILLLGSTGVGKSNFIECLSGDESLDISKDQLESVTRDITTYRVVNVEDVDDEGHIYLIDTPGFADRKISEMKILKMVQAWLADREKSGFDRVLYFDRITDTRMSGSKGRNLDLFKALTSENTAENITVVTTMWDLLWNEGQKIKAEKRYQQLQDQHWKEFIDQGARIVKFANSKSSALGILDNSMATWSYTASNFERNAHRKSLRTAPYATPLYKNLLDRVSQLQSSLQYIEQDLIQPSTQKNAILRDIFLQDKAEVEGDLRGALREVEDFGPPPPGFVADVEHLNIEGTSSFVSFHYLFPESQPESQPPISTRRSKLRTMYDKTRQKANYLFRFKSRNKG
ncbi:P-loop containing nucleoside triphosphate hydrolase protein [Panaeolus papilionaceus]|nr:P-loop containing nucleoside triphosphate hydrolase protein [Panaeolus papilionaceus]